MATPFERNLIPTPLSSLKELGGISETWSVTELGLSLDLHRHIVALVLADYEHQVSDYESDSQAEKNDETTKPKVVVFILVNEQWAREPKFDNECREAIRAARYSLRKQHPQAHIVTENVSSDLILNAMANIASEKGDEQQRNDSEKEIDELLDHCYKVNASDIHIACGDHENMIKLRRDGELMPYGTERNIDSLHTLVSVLYSSLAGRDGEIRGTGFEATEKLDGSLFREVGGRRLGARIVSHPTNKKKKNFYMVLRCTGDQNTDAERIPFNQLGFLFNQIDKVKKATDGKGISLIIGETNSGKSVTLENILMEINRENNGTKNILSVENPIERNIKGVNQFTLVKSGVTKPEEMTVAVENLMSFVTRADPDDVAIGEINNRHTCETAVQSALTGHNVMATMHVDSPFDIFERFTGLGANANALRSSEVLKLGVAQKLFKKICPHCSQSIDQIASPNALQLEAIESLAFMGLGHWIPKVKFRNMQGCDACERRGIRGRQMVAEIVDFTPQILRLLCEEKKEEAQIAWLSDGNFTKHDIALVNILNGNIDPTEAIKQFKSITESFEFRKKHSIQNPNTVYR
ncbi:Flp pilus assembly complex ATPase component TadA [Vibrio tubiashii]|uniref:GspE/PulE family protein n=1 Tax=Vibrio tubiashii TaxID=29498 RepID=UPI001EFE209C|nr:ATPase, T2SS/T4P/T4SS family [Vibrio tubiashii]MCG9578614.1 Flp pilus assembly complex ATPase component TadA [Vibrio tubiashii]